MNDINAVFAERGKVGDTYWFFAENVTAEKANTVEAWIQSNLPNEPYAKSQQELPGTCFAYTGIPPTEFSRVGFGFDNEAAVEIFKATWVDENATLTVPEPVFYSNMRNHWGPSLNWDFEEDKLNRVRAIRRVFLHVLAGLIDKNGRGPASSNKFLASHFDSWDVMKAPDGYDYLVPLAKLETRDDVQAFINDSFSDPSRVVMKYCEENLVHYVDCADETAAVTMKLKFG